MRFLFIRSGTSFNARQLAKQLKVSPTAISKSLKGLEREGLVSVKKDKDSGRLSIELNKDNRRVFYLKRIENLKLIYESGLVEYLSENFPGATIILFGSYSFGEDTTNSDIDIAIIGSKEKDTNLIQFDKLIERKVSLHFYENFTKMDKNLKENIFNGIVLKGGIHL